MRVFFSKLGKPVRGFAEAPTGQALATLAVLALILNIVLEMLGRRSFLEPFAFIISSPLMFILNTLIILFTLSLCLIVPRRMPFLLILTGAWLTLGIANAIVLSYRSSPLSAIDFLVLKATLGLATVYFTVVQLIAIGLIAAAFIAVVVVMFIKLPRSRIAYHKSIACVLAIGLSLFAASTIANADDSTSYESGELSDAYHRYGFAYCFTRSLLSQGVERPNGYTHDRVDELIDSLGSESTSSTDTNDNGTPSVLPNIIFVQLESFFDVNTIEWLETSADPTPNFNAIKTSGVSGYLRVPHVGGGTANAEFEVLTGMNLDHFGFGEYPYTTVLKSRACESIAQNLRTLGYTAHAIHNHIATFYDRNIAYANLGFDTFTPIEFMSDITRNPLGWARDTVLTNEILSALDSTDTSDFVFAVSVQGHGKYPSEPLDESDNEQDGYVGALSGSVSESAIDVLNIDDEAILSQYVYYVNQLHEMDAFIGELTAALTKRGEPCVVVFYGDHLPALPLEEGDLASGDMYKTEYAIWTNLADLFTDASSHDRDLEAYQLSAYLMSLLGIEEGDINALHQYSFTVDEDIDEKLRLLEYAQLYDPEQIGYTPAKLTFGTRQFEVSSYLRTDNALYIKGSGFNEYTSVKLNGLKRATELVDSSTLKINNVYFDVKELEVLQMADDGTELAAAIHK